MAGKLVEAAFHLQKTMVDLLEAVINLLKPTFHLLKPSVYLLEAVIDLFEPVIYPLNPAADLVAPRFDAIQTFIDQVQPSPLRFQLGMQRLHLLVQDAVHQAGMIRLSLQVVDLALQRSDLVPNIIQADIRHRCSSLASTARKPARSGARVGCGPIHYLLYLPGASSRGEEHLDGVRGKNPAATPRRSGRG